jgi:hypothetical protein
VVINPNSEGAHHLCLEGSGSGSEEEDEDLRSASESLEAVLTRMRNLNVLDHRGLGAGPALNSVESKGPSVPTTHEAIHNHLWRTPYARWI